MAERSEDRASGRRSGTTRSPASAGADVPVGLRARARAATLDHIKQVARRHLAEEGTALSLRAVARDLGVVSSAVYRYFDSREALLAALAADARANLADAVTEADSRVSRRDAAARWLAFARAVRGWAAEHPHEFGLLYGVPAGRPNVDTGGAADGSGPVRVLVAVLAGAAGGSQAGGSERVARSLRTQLERAAGETGLPPAAVARALTAWAQLIGAISLELSRRSALITDDAEGWFDYQARLTAGYLGLGGRG